MIDNFSRRILAWRVAETFTPGNSVAVLVEASRAATPSETTPLVLADAGVENVNAQVDALITSGVLRRVLAFTELTFSNSMIEAWWRALKHQSWEDANLRAHGYTPHRVRKTGALLAPSQQALGQTDLHWHDLRHEYASRLAESGVPITEIQRLLGHASVRTTERSISTTLARLKQSAVVLERGKDFDPRPLGSTPIVKPSIAGIH